MAETQAPIDPSIPQDPFIDEENQATAVEEDTLPVENAVFDVHINKAMLDGIVIKMPAPEERQGWGSLGDAEAEIAAKQAELQGVIEKVKAFPETLQFEPGITLIVGENGGGKSTIGRALKLAADYHSKLAFRRENPRPKRGADDEQEEDLEESTFNWVFRPNGGTDAENLGMAGVGAYIAPALLEGTQFKSKSGFHYVDVGEIYGRSQSNARSTLLDSTRVAQKLNQKTGQMEETIVEVKGNGSFDVKSTRQTVDAQLAQYKEVRSGNSRWGDEQPTSELGSVEFVDEPESGLSPRRHQNIEGEIYEVFGAPDKGNIVIVPTNSVILFQSDLPRIDLDYPERGIHRPSDYPDGDGIQ